MGRIAGLLKEEMPREKLIRFGPEVLTNVELLAIVLRTGVSGKSVLELSREILSEFDFKRVSRVSIADLMKFNGVNSGKAAIVVSLFELARRLKDSSLEVSKKVRFRNSKEIFEFVKDDFLYLGEERFLVVFLNARNEVIRSEFLFSGGFSFSFVDLKVVFKRALELCCCGVVLVHNHPSGDCSPSEEDLKLTKQFRKGCSILGLRLVDHLIVSDLKYLSFFDRAIL